MEDVVGMTWYIDNVMADGAFVSRDDLALKLPCSEAYNKVQVKCVVHLRGGDVTSDSDKGWVTIKNHGEEVITGK